MQDEIMTPLAVAAVAFAFFAFALLLMSLAIRVRRVESSLAKMRVRINEPDDDDDDDDEPCDYCAYSRECPRCEEEDMEKIKLKSAGVTVKRWTEAMR